MLAAPGQAFQGTSPIRQPQVYFTSKSAILFILKENKNQVSILPQQCEVAFKSEVELF